MADRVLIADDDATTAHLISVALTKRGFETRVEPTGTDALAVAREWQPNVVILDVMMPAAHGMSVCRALKEAPETRGVRVLILTAKPYESDRRFARDMGADDYMTKPFDIQELASKVAELTERS
jgi:DNA-binding response OmpR family regulator